MKLIICILVIFGCASAQLKNTSAEAILKFHNDVRSSIAKGTYRTSRGLLPAASNMRKMKWDYGLANTIQDFLNGCPMTDFPTNFGQNVYTFSARFSNISDAEALYAATNWTMPLAYFAVYPLQFNEATRRIRERESATQMAWADTEFIGCGAKKCESPRRPGMFEFLMVCLYKEKGNILNSNVYQQGKTCTSCPSGFKCEGDSGLCVRN